MPDPPDDYLLYRRIPSRHWHTDKNTGCVRASSDAFDFDDDDELCVFRQDVLEAMGLPVETVFEGHDRSEYAIAAFPLNVALALDYVFGKNRPDDHPAHIPLIRPTKGRSGDPGSKIRKKAFWAIPPPHVDVQGRPRPAPEQE